MPDTARPLKKKASPRDEAELEYINARKAHTQAKRDVARANKKVRKFLLSVNESMREVVEAAMSAS